MSSSYDVKAIIRAAREQNNALDQQLGEIKKRDVKHMQEVAALNKEVLAAWANLTEQLVPTLDAPSLDAAATRLMLPTLHSARIQAAMNADRAAQEAIIRRVESDPLYVQREPRLNDLNRRWNELNEFIEPLKETVTALKDAPHFQELFNARYGTGAYDKGWWTLSYYRDWKNGDELVEKFGQRMESTDFGRLSARFRDECANLEALQTKANELALQRKAIQDLVTAHARAQEAIQKLPERHLTLVRAQCRQHLESLDDAERVKLCDTPTLQLACKRISGVTAKLGYLEGLHREMVIKPREDLMRMKQKNDKDITKLMLPKKRGFVMPAEDYNRRFRDRHDAWNKRWDRYDNTRSQIIIYDRYDRYDPIREFLWWDLMTDGRLDGNFIPEVQEYHSTYGTVHHHDDAISAVASDNDSALHHSDVS